MFRTIRVERDGRVARVWFDRPDVRNAFNAVMIGELREALRSLAADDAVRVVVLSGRGPTFCAGADHAWMRDAARFSADQNLRETLDLAECLHDLYALPKPTIARVNGTAIGGGNGFLAACDIIVASREAIIGLSEAKFGLVFAPAVAAVDNRDARPFRGFMRRSLLKMAHHQHIPVELEHLYRVLDRLLVKITRPGHLCIRKTEHMTTYAVDGCFVCQTRARRWLIESRYQRLFFEHIHVFSGPGNGLHFLSHVEHVEEFIPLEFLERKDVTTSKTTHVETPYQKDSVVDTQSGTQAHK